MSDDMWRRGTRRAKRGLRPTAVRGRRRRRHRRPRRHRRAPAALRYHDTGPLPHWTEPPTGEMPRWRWPPSSDDDTTDDDSTCGRRSRPRRPSGATTSPTTRPAIEAGGVDADLTGVGARRRRSREPLSRPADRARSRWRRRAASRAGSPSAPIPPTSLGRPPAGRPPPRRRAPSSARAARPARRARPAGPGRRRPARHADGHRRRLLLAAALHRRHAVAPGRRARRRSSIVLASPGSSTSTRSPRRATGRRVIGHRACVAAPLAAYWVGERHCRWSSRSRFIAGAIAFIGAPSLESGPMPNMAITTLGVVWIGLLGSFAALILALVEPRSASTNVGTDTLFLIALGVVANDVGALLVGSRRQDAAARLDQPQQDGRGPVRRHGARPSSRCSSSGSTGRATRGTPAT